MSGIVLSSSVRQNLLSLQSTADLLATTQNRLSTGKKVNTALDNPTNYFTAASLDNRASDINNLLDGIGNGVQVLQAANTGISSLQKLVDSAKSVATQALQATVGYSSKSSVSVSINGATANNLLGTGAPIDATFHRRCRHQQPGCGLFQFERHRRPGGGQQPERLYRWRLGWFGRAAGLRCCRRHDRHLADAAVRPPISRLACSPR